MWGWRAGERSTWWLLLATSVVGFGAALAIHIAVGYIDLFHLFPVYTGIVWVAIALSISRRWFFTRL